VFACRGNWEVKHDSPRLSRQRQELAERGVQLLVNESVTMGLPAGRVRLAGLDDVLVGWPSMEETLARGTDADYTVLLAHAPMAAELPGRDGHADLVLCGHTHGGQVRVPLVWKALLPHGTGPYAAGLFDLEDRLLYVSRGFGNAGQLNWRWRCPAEVAIFELVGG
jgi:hypothetical protein